MRGDEPASGPADYGSVIEPIRSVRTFEEVSNRLKELIFNGTLKPGQKLPSEQALAQLFHVGRQSVREALRVLELSGFITVKAGAKGGPLIQGTMLSKIAGLFLDAFRFNRVSLEDYLSARRAIELSVLDFVFRNARTSDLDALADNVARARAKQAANEVAFEENIEFHLLLGRASRNYIFLIVMESIIAVLSDLRSKLTAQGGVERSRLVTDVHEGILQAIVGKKKRKAVELIDRDLAMLTEILLTGPSRRSEAQLMARGRQTRVSEVRE